MHIVYRGVGWDKTAIGYFEDGEVYSGTGWAAKKIGEYDRGTIYRGSGWDRTEVGKFEYDAIYRGVGGESKEVGKIEFGSIYSGLGWGQEEVGKYDLEGSKEGAAAAALLLGLVEDGEKELGGPEIGSITFERVVIAIVAVLFAYASVRVAWPGTLQTLRQGNYESVPALIVIGLACISGCIDTLRNRKVKNTITDVGSNLFDIYIGGLLIQYIIYYIMAGVSGELTVGNFFIVLFGLAAVNFGLIFPFYVIQVLVLWLLKKFCFK